MKEGEILLLGVALYSLGMIFLIPKVQILQENYFLGAILFAFYIMVFAWYVVIGGYIRR